MSCIYCESKEPLPCSDDGSFMIKTCGFVESNGKIYEHPAIKFEADGVLFDSDVYVTDAAKIKYCPMCGENLVIDE